jgi:hypothetical protein
MPPTRPPEPQSDAYRHRHRLLVALHAEGILGDLLRAACDRYRISAWCGNERRGLDEAVGILGRVLATQELDDELREMITLTIEEMRSLKRSKRLMEISIRYEGLEPPGWPGFDDEGGSAEQ